MATSEWAHWLSCLGAAYLGALVFLALAAKEWSYREAWLQIDGERRAKKAKLEAEIHHNRTILDQINRTGQAALNRPPSTPAIHPNRPPTKEQAA